MRLKHFLSASLILSFLLLSDLISQQPPCMPDYYGLTYSVEKLESSPPLSVYMPFDVLVGYIALDTISHNVYKDEFVEFLNNQTYNDTIKYMMKHFYQLVDYDPILWIQTCNFNDAYTVWPSDMEYEIKESIIKVSDDKFADVALFRSHIIVHIRVTDTLSRITPSAGIYKTAAIVTCEILDTIKGLVIPSCKDVSIQDPIITKKNKYDKIQDFPDNCMQFEYRLEWGRPWTHRIAHDSSGKIISPRMVDQDGNAWVKKDSEYIVFLRLELICSDSSNIYYGLSPRVHNSVTGGIYPIIDNIVYDPDDEFGFGPDLTPIAFKSALRMKIDEITNYPGE